jgi:hypothetical protein
VISLATATLLLLTGITELLMRIRSRILTFFHTIVYVYCNPRPNTIVTNEDRISLAEDDIKCD